MKKVAVGLSGGVDSAVAAYLLKKQGYEVIGITMQIWEDDIQNEGCSSQLAVLDAKKVADKLGIPHYVLNFKKEFDEKVVQYFMNEYMNARTPNPCIVCNRYVKWEALLKRANELGCDYVATGHYARIVQLENGRYTLKMSATMRKDQTYALYQLTQEQLSKTLMPLGEYDKEEIRKIAEEIGLFVANKPDSMEICFIPDDDYAGYIERESGKFFPTGNFVDLNGNVLGTHKGLIHYTIGQRKGLGLSLGKPAFVVELRKDSNEVVIGTNEDTFHDCLIADHINFMSISKCSEEITVKAKIRYSHQGEMCKISMLNDNEIKCSFVNPVRAITPGQAVVFYDENNAVVGGATIVKTL